MDELPVMDELATMEEPPAVDELPIVEELPIVDELPLVDELPTIDELKDMDELRDMDDGEIGEIGDEPEKTPDDEKDDGKKEDIDLEEGEILSDDEPDAGNKGVPKLSVIRNEDHSFSNNRPYNRPLLGHRPSNNTRWGPPDNRYGRQPQHRTANYVLRPMPGNAHGPDSTWDNTLKQAQDIISLATRGDTNGSSRFDSSSSRRQRSVSPGAREDGVKRRRRSPSSEDEAARRHRLAFETAPGSWNSSRGDRPLLRRDDTYSNTGRGRADPNGSDRRRSRFSPDELHSSSSHSSYETRRLPPGRGTPERRLPYERPSNEERSKYVEKNDSRDKSSTSGPNSSARFDRILKKYSLNAADNHSRSKSVASDKSYDSWSESLSDSSSSYYTDSDSKLQKKRDKKKKKSKKKEKEKKEKARHRTLSRDKDSDSDDDRQGSKSPSPVTVKKPEAPIKMQFMKKGNILQKSSIISDDELPDFETAEAMIAGKKPFESQRRPQSRNSPISPEAERLSSSSSSSSDDDSDDPSANVSEEARREIERKLEILNQQIAKKLKK